MGPVGHAAISSVIGVSVWGMTSSPVAGGVAVGAGVLVDVDHIFDFYQWWIRRRTSKIYLFLHGWEYSIAGLLTLWLGYYHPVLLAVVLAHLGHVATDHFHNRLSVLGYFILYRIWVRFDTKKIAPNTELNHFHQILPALLPLRRFWEPWYRRKIVPWISSRLNTDSSKTKNPLDD